ncbi:nuclear transport factor 2 family protein [Moraxella bovis]|uniref:Nuclear transport factor 2 family protein n=1 Tax=Moraxella bovis TaxID=476 RepID=A0AAQ2Q132_MORBO|nr:nuclear transport factor 2 family protein [Moraxella bovis]AWY20836.1 hypothetical protein DQF64_10295 [Moraxella bovis]UYZ76487.1 nuclear transport factor 2 family protein [Moraxella bovis]UYZ77561.1 nuclear transport factor 2 family protein [Moraxella bovis]UYZ81939.1 nuclear transport factor 2 family protein [Moraxella bovis]UYZ86047.1 nuclear transport factor 2 family protein [Moraxella bovis]
MKKILKVVAVGGLMMTLWHKKGQGKSQSDTTTPISHARRSRGWLPVIGSALLVGTAVMTAPAYAMSESAVQSFANSLNTAANAQNIGMVSRLIDDNAVISLTRKGNTTTLDKNGYLQLLQKSWAGASDYRYSINATDVVVTGNQARANVITTESWTKDGRRTTFRTHSKATLSYIGGNAMLLRAVSQVTVE